MPECPTCGEEFDTELGVKHHHSRTHGESLSKNSVECANCGEELHKKNWEMKGVDRHFCDRTCKREFMSCAKPDESPWQDEETLQRLYHEQGVSQEEIAEHFDVSRGTIQRWVQRHDLQKQLTPPVLKSKPSLERLYCEKKLSSIEIADRLDCTTPTVLRWMDIHGIERRGREKPEARVSAECSYCGDEIRRFPSQIHAYERNFCDQGCQGEWRRENWGGEDAPRWKEDPAYTRYGPNWGKQRNKARERDGYTCQGCGLEESEHPRELSVHHIIPRAEYIAEDGKLDHERANRLENLVTLCNSCHSRWERVPGLRPDTRDASAD